MLTAVSVRIILQSAQPEINSVLVCKQSLKLTNKIKTNCRSNLVMKIWKIDLLQQFKNQSRR